MKTVLSLFSGAGGGVLADKLLGNQVTGYVEKSDYPARILRQRIIDGHIPNAPIYGDINTFISDGYAEAYCGMVDIVTAGFPCQPFSVASSKRTGADDSRNMWPSTMEVIRRVRPRSIFCENVPGLLASTVDDAAGRPVQYFGSILRDLSQARYDVRWCVLGADDGANGKHKRKRLWIAGRLR